MPAKRNQKDLAEAKAQDDAPSGQDHAPSGQEESLPLNRAERRARGKKTTPPPSYSRGKVTGSKGPVQSQRMWANRRSG